jgi:hypothetical protein
MSDKIEMYKQIAMEQRMYFDWLRSTEIFVSIRDHDINRLYRLKDACGGKVADGAYSHRSSKHSDIWGRYEWHIRGEEAYQFCLGLLPYLGPFHPKRGWCKGCIRAHEDRRYESTGT